MALWDFRCSPLLNFQQTFSRSFKFMWGFGLFCWATAFDLFVNESIERIAGTTIPSKTKDVFLDSPSTVSFKSARGRITRLFLSRNYVRKQSKTNSPIEVFLLVVIILMACNCTQIHNLWNDIFGICVSFIQSFFRSSKIRWFSSTR